MASDTIILTDSGDGQSTGETASSFSTETPIEKQEKLNIPFFNERLISWQGPALLRTSVWGGLDPNVGFLRDRLNPSAYLKFKNINTEENMVVRYQTDVVSYGLKADLGVRVFGAMLTASKEQQLIGIPREIQLGAGFEVECLFGFGMIKVVAPVQGTLFYGGQLSGVGVSVFPSGGRLIRDDQFDYNDARTHFPMTERSYLKPSMKMDPNNKNYYAAAWRLALFYGAVMFLLGFSGITLYTSYQLRSMSLEQQRTRELLHEVVYTGQQTETAILQQIANRDKEK